MRIAKINAEVHYLRKIFGFLIIIICFSLFVLFGKSIVTESKKLQETEQQIDEAIQLQPVASNKPLKLVDRYGNIYSEEYVEWRQPITFEKIPSIVKQIFIISEDEQFYTHIGFNVSAIARAFLTNLQEDSIKQGGSTITQQLVRMRYLSNEKTYERKISELFYAYKLENSYSKDEILEMYLNEAYFGNQVYGIESAATYYFNKSLGELTLAEMAFISAIPNNPSLYDPIQHFDNTKERQERLIDQLVEHNIISKAEGEKQKSASIKLSVKQKLQNYPAYTAFVLNELKELITYEVNKSFEHAKSKDIIAAKVDEKYNQLLQSGATIYTALDPTKQEGDEKALDNILKYYPFQGSAVVIDNATREIVSVYPGKNYKKFDLHRAYQAFRQPGSAFKPIAVYAPFIQETGSSTNYLVSSNNYCVGSYCPSNYGGGQYGTVTLSTAFKYSYNTSALRLLEKIGVENSYHYVSQFHFSKIHNNDYYYSAALGGLTYGVTPAELAGAYTSFVDGSYTRPTSIKLVKNSKGETIYQWSKEPKIIWNSKTTNVMKELMNDVVTSGTAASMTAMSGYVGAKTGTTNNYNDFWIAGFNDRYTAAVWIGFDTPSSMQRYEDAHPHFQMFYELLNN